MCIGTRTLQFHLCTRKYRIYFSPGMKSWQIVFVTKYVWASEEVDLMMIAYNRVVIELSDNSRKSLYNGQ